MTTCLRLRGEADRLLYEALARGEFCYVLIYDEVRAGQCVKDDETSPLVTKLHLAGIVRAEKGQLAVRNRIYATVFDRRWVRESLPNAEVRRQRAAYRKGLLRAASVAALVLTNEPAGTRDRDRFRCILARW